MPTTPQEMLDAAVTTAAAVDQLCAGLDDYDRRRAAAIKDQQQMLADLLKLVPAGHGLDDTRAILLRAKGKLTQRRKAKR